MKTEHSHYVLSIYYVVSTGKMYFFSSVTKNGSLFSPCPLSLPTFTPGSDCSIVTQSDSTRSGQYEQKDVLLWRIMVWGTPPHMEDLENTPPFPVIHHRCFPKMETGARVSSTLANPSARKMELGHRGGGSCRGRTKEREIRREKKGCLDTHQRLTQKAKRQPSGGSLAFHFGFCVLSWSSQTELFYVRYCFSSPSRCHRVTRPLSQPTKSRRNWSPEKLDTLHRDTQLANSRARILTRGYLVP